MGLVQTEKICILLNIIEAAIFNERAISRNIKDNSIFFINKKDEAIRDFLDVGVEKGMNSTVKNDEETKIYKRNLTAEDTTKKMGNKEGKF